MDKEKLQKILENHKLWLSNSSGGYANLSYEDLRGANLIGANLRDADLSFTDLGGANLRSADLRGANLSHAHLNDADLSYANLRGADLRGVNLRDADLRGVNLSCANLGGANLRSADLRGTNLSHAHLNDADLSGVKYNENTAFFALQCPEEGSFVGWKKCKNNVIVKLLIPEDAKRSSATTRKCRASKAIVLEVIGAETAVSTYDETFGYDVGKEVVPDSFDDNRWDECSNGIHFFTTKKEAEDY